ncbi:dihydroorotase [Thermosyntropha lipolytica DSM 11003]|uniref:Dihydroorotase n=1 Tax=Thermosyntropha lipolytica DSM 11003 TaxID=1123382 RepID=A0A1M5PY11_9FIRM|nr:dihydroorotase [Thermosyntropha lipolytica]SHH06570.1 dihydroorotase [Thermosyntropha lipolytica DSM 11003]
MRLLVKGGRVVDPANDLDKVLDILVEDDKIVETGQNIYAEDCIIIEAHGKLVCPGFIDLHTHLREPGFEYKEDIYSGTRAAAAGGFTTVCCMPNTDPVADNKTVISFIKEQARVKGVVNVLPVGAISKKQEGQELSPIAELFQAGCVALSDDGRPVRRADLMRYAMEYAKMFDLPIFSHCEDRDLSGDGQVHEGFYSTYYGLKGIPAAAEEVMVARDIILSQLTGAKVHICHVSTRGSVELIRRAKEEGVNVTAEVTPHHLVLTDEVIGSYDADTKVNPPLRSREHVEALLKGLNEGVIDCIATDHAPHEREAKDCEYNMAAFGISGLETAIPVSMKLVHEGKLSLKRWVEAYTVKPASILNIDRGSLTPGGKADITIIDPELIKTVEVEKFYSRGWNTPFKGMKFKGWPFMTIVNGKIVFEDGEIKV